MRKEAPSNIDVSVRVHIPVAEAGGHTSRRLSLVRGSGEGHAPRLSRRLRRTHKLDSSLVPSAEAKAASAVIPSLSEAPVAPREDAKKQARKDNGTIGALVRNKKLRPEHVGENGQIDMDAVLNDNYFRVEHPEYNELLANHTLSAKSKLRKEAERTPKPPKAEDRTAGRRKRRGLAVISSEGAVLFAGVVFANQAAAAENTREARVDTRADVLAQVSAPITGTASSVDASSFIPNIPALQNQTLNNAIITFTPELVPAATMQREAEAVGRPRTEPGVPQPKPAAVNTETQSNPPLLPGVEADALKAGILQGVNDTGKLVHDAAAAVLPKPIVDEVVDPALFATYDAAEEIIDGVLGTSGKVDGQKYDQGHAEELYSKNYKEYLEYCETHGKTPKPPVTTTGKPHVTLPPTTVTTINIPDTTSTTTVSTTSTTAFTTTSTTNRPARTTTSTSTTLPPTTSTSTTVPEVVVPPTTPPVRKVAPPAPAPEAPITTSTTAAQPIPEGSLVRTGVDSADATIAGVVLLVAGIPAVLKTMRTSKEYATDESKRKAKKKAKKLEKQNGNTAKAEIKQRKLDAKWMKKQQKRYRRDQEWMNAQIAAFQETKSNKPQRRKLVAASK